MTHNLDRIIDRRHSDSAKWTYYPEDVLPLWVADIDFAAQEPVTQALHEYVDQGDVRLRLRRAAARAPRGARRAPAPGYIASTFRQRRWCSPPALSSATTRPATRWCGTGRGSLDPDAGLPTVS